MLSLHQLKAEDSDDDDVMKNFLHPFSSLILVPWDAESFV